MENNPIQLEIDFRGSDTGNLHEAVIRSEHKKISGNKLDPKDRAFHDWYRFVLSYPPHLVRDYIEKFKLDDRSVIFDPFCGTGTTLVEAKLAGLYSIGVEANPFPHFATTVKLDWSISPDLLLSRSHNIAEATNAILMAQGIDDNFPFELDGKYLSLRTLGNEAKDLLITNSISPLPLHKILILLECLKTYQNESFFGHALLALANALVYKISNLRFGPEVGVDKLKLDIPVVDNWIIEVEKIVNDLRSVAGQQYPRSDVHLADARDLKNIPSNSIDAVITSPPYPNEKDYTRTTRLESVLLGFIKNIDYRTL